MHSLYNIAIRLYVFGIHLAAPFVPKAAKWVEGRRRWKDDLARRLAPLGSARLLWMHVSSLGEFEQGRPVLEKFHEAFPDWRIVLSFFSPSGFELRKDYPLADIVTYLPSDTPANAAAFLDILRPNAAIFVKYDFWANYLLELRKRQVPTLLVSALFRPSQPFFQPYGRLWRDMLHCFDHIFVQNEDSARLLRGILADERVTVAGDTRVDRVLRIASQAPENALVQVFAGSSPAIIVGSSWEADEALLAGLLRDTAFQGVKCIIAPHEPSKKRVQAILRHFEDAVPYSVFQPEMSQSTRVLVIDNVGMLNTLYRYGRWAYIGGGFGKGIHNTLEPAAFGLPIIFGPKFEKFEEARQFIAEGAAFSVQGADSLQAAFQKLQDAGQYERATVALRRYLEHNQGASEAALTWLKRRFA